MLIKRTQQIKAMEAKYSGTFNLCLFGMFFGYFVFVWYSHFSIGSLGQTGLQTKILPIFAADLYWSVTPANSIAVEWNFEWTMFSVTQPTISVHSDVFSEI